MRTDKQIAASRANGAKSRGPLSPEGKTRSARNSLKHGLLARIVVLPDESSSRFENFVALLNEALHPETAMDHLLIGKMAAAHWRQIRIWNREREGDKTLGDEEMKLDRQFFRSFDRYLRIRSAQEYFLQKRTRPQEPDKPTEDGQEGIQ